MGGNRSLGMKRALSAALSVVFLSLAVAPAGGPSLAQPVAPSSALQGDLSELLHFPFLRVNHSVIYDAANDRLVAFGGWNGRSFTNDAWALELTPGSEGWVQLLCDCTAPAPRGQHSAVYDQANGRMVVFGGHNRNHNFNDVWALDLTAGAEVWTQLLPSGDAPLPRRWHTAVVDESGGQMLVFGGAGAGALQNDTWALTLAPGTESWAQLTPDGTPPPARAQHTAVYDSLHRWMVVFGGRGESAALNDLWLLNLAGNAWTQAAPGGAPPPARQGHTAVYVEQADRMLLFGGLGSDGFYNDLWAITLAPGQAVWQELSPAGDPPGPRAWHTASLDTQHGRMVVLGGRGMQGLAGEAQWVLYLDPLRWEPLYPLPLTAESDASTLEGNLQTFPYLMHAALAVEDAGPGTHVDLLYGSVVRFTASLWTTQASLSYDLDVTLTVHDPDDNPATPLPVEMVRAGTRDGPARAVNWLPVNDLGGGRYELQDVDLTRTGLSYGKLVVFEVNILATEADSTDLDLSLSVFRPDWRWDVDDSAAATLWRDPQVWVVTNRSLLFDYYDNYEVMDLLRALYQEADDSGRSMVVLYANRYVPALEDWDNTDVDYTNETTANEMADELARWLVNWMVGGDFPQFAYPQYLVIVGDDNIIPRYRKADYDIWCSPTDDCSEDGSPQCYGRELLCYEMVAADFFWTDNPYGDQEYGTVRQDWEVGDLEAAVGRIAGANAKDMRQALERAADGPNEEEERGIIASCALDNFGIWDCMDWRLPNITDAEDVIHDYMGYAIDASMVDGDPTKPEIIDEMEAGFSIAALAHHGEVTTWQVPGGSGGMGGCGPGFLGSWEVPDYDPQDLMSVNRPFFYFNACRVGISYSRGWDDPQCADDRPDRWDDSMVNSLVHQGASGIVASGGLTYYYSGNDSYGDSEALSNDFWYVARDTPDRSDPLGWALMRAKDRYNASSDTAKKTVQEFTYFGLPYMRLPGHGGGLAARSAPFQADATAPAWSAPQGAAPEASYTTTATVDASTYAITSVDGFDLIEVQGLSPRMEGDLPVLPQATLELVLPLSATVTSLAFTPTQEVALHDLDIPRPLFGVGIPGGPTGGYTTTLDGVYPVTATWDVVPLDTYQLVRVNAIPVTYDATDNAATLYRNMDLQVGYDTPHTLALSYFEADADQSVPGQPIGTLSRIVNAGDTDVAATARLLVLNAAGQLVGFHDAGPFPVPAGGSYDLALGWTGPLEAGTYGLRLLVSQDAQVVAGAGRQIWITAGEIAGLSVPEGLMPGEQGMFEVTFENHSASATVAVAQLVLYSPEGALVAFLEPQTGAVPAGGSGVLSFTWTPPRAGPYVASATVVAGGQEYGPVSAAFGGGSVVYLPLVMRND